MVRTQPNVALAGFLIISVLNIKDEGPKGRSDGDNEKASATFG